MNNPEKEATLSFNAPMSAELSEELQEWQELGQEVWMLFPYEENEASRDVLP